MDLSRRSVLGTFAAVILGKYLPPSFRAVAECPATLAAPPVGSCFLTMQQITCEALRLLHNGTANVSILRDPRRWWGVDHLEDGLTQFGVDMYVPLEELALPLEDFSLRFLKPAVYCMADQLRDSGKKIVVHRLKLPEYDAAIAGRAETDGLSLRSAIAPCVEFTTDDRIVYDFSCRTVRFDMLYGEV